MATASPVTRPTTTITIGGTEYTARCPKLARWQSFATLDTDTVANRQPGHSTAAGRPLTLGAH